MHQEIEIPKHPFFYGLLQTRASFPHFYQDLSNIQYSPCNVTLYHMRTIHSVYLIRLKLKLPHRIQLLAGRLWQDTLASVIMFCS